MLLFFKSYLIQNRIDCMKLCLIEFLIKKFVLFECNVKKANFAFKKLILQNDLALNGFPLVFLSCSIQVIFFVIFYY